ncbi:SDR family oxidoreductase [Neptunicoccus sediminis]|uniref:SDR family oxidoreductase n=1 Tax=Neptunicoccus sediminis TaxID=1892596 RepID=UPI0008460675|nr:SDR family oxidoreductase [Neptunicoccus sediminis]
MIYRAALVTGGARRLGRAMVLALAERGVDVAVHYAGSAQEAEETVAEAQALGVKAVALQADLLELEDTQKLIPRAVEALGQPLDVLINNASVFEYDRIESATPEGWDRHMNSNLRAPFFLTQAFAEQAPEARKVENGEMIATSAVINMVDQRVRKLTPEFMTYTLAKMGLWAFTQTAARGLAPAVRVNAIGPGPTMIGERQSDSHFANQRQNTVLQRGSNPEEIVAAMNYLLDSPATTGQLLCVDGGQHLGWQTPDIQGFAGAISENSS